MHRLFTVFIADTHTVFISDNELRQVLTDCNWQSYSFLKQVHWPLIKHSFRVSLRVEDVQVLKYKEGWETWCNTGLMSFLI